MFYFVGMLVFIHIYRLGIIITLLLTVIFCREQWYKIIYKETEFNTNDIHIYTYLYWLQGTMLGSHDAQDRVYIQNTWQRS